MNRAGQVTFQNVRFLIMPNNSIFLAGLFSGRTNAIYLSREYYQEYACEFDLLYYPFDTQLCFMIFEVQGKTDNYIRLDKDHRDGPGIGEAIF